MIMILRIIFANIRSSVLFTMWSSLLTTLHVLTHLVQPQEKVLRD